MNLRLKIHSPYWRFVTIMKTPVSIVKGDNPYETAYKALQALPQPKVKDKRVLLKSNISRLLPYTQGAKTHPQVVAAAIDYFKECGAAEVAVGESPITGVRMPEAYTICGFALNLRVENFE